MSTEAFGALSGVRAFVACVGEAVVAVSAPDGDVASETTLALLDLATLTPAKEYEGLRFQLTPASPPLLK